MKKNISLQKQTFIMSGSGDGVFYKAVFILGVTFAVGFVTGYKAKELRMEWLKRRRERLAVKLQAKKLIKSI